MSHITVAIVTRNRSISLSRCLHSLAPQMASSDEILVIDNNSADSTKKVIRSYKQKTVARLVYYQEKQIGISLCRNRAVEKSHGRWIAFIDDDCVVTKNWAEHMRRSFTYHPDAAAIAGPNKPQDKRNPYSLATAFLYDFWSTLSLKGNKIYNYEMLDTKNVAYRKSFLLKNAIRFDPALPLGEDCDVGIQIEKKGGKAYYNQHLAVLHQHPTSIKRYTITQLAYSLSAVQILIKWHPRKTKFAKNISLFSFLYQYKKNLKYAGSVPIFYIVVIMTLAVNKILFFIYSFDFFRRVLAPITKRVLSAYANRTIESRLTHLTF